MRSPGRTHLSDKLAFACLQALGLDAILNAAPTQPALEGLAAEVGGIPSMRLIDLGVLKDALLQR